MNSKQPLLRLLDGLATAGRLTVIWFALLLGLAVPGLAGGPGGASPSDEHAVTDHHPEREVRVVVVVRHLDRTVPHELLVLAVVGDPRLAGCNLYAYCDGDPVNRSDPMGLDWGYVDGAWHRIKGTPNIPKPPVGLTPQIIGKNRYGAIEWAMYENFGDEQFRIGGGNTAGYRAGKEARWKSFTDEQKVALIEKAYRYGDVVADIVNAGNGVIDSIEESALWVSPALLAANGVAGVTVQKDLLGRPQSRLDGAKQLAALGVGVGLGKGLAFALDSEAARISGAGGRSYSTEPGVVTAPRPQVPSAEVRLGGGIPEPSTGGTYRAGLYDPDRGVLYLGPGGHFDGGAELGAQARIQSGPGGAATPGISMVETQTSVYWANDSMSLPYALTEEQAAAVQAGLQQSFPSKNVIQLESVREVPRAER